MDYFVASKRLCICENCLNFKFENCSEFTKYRINVSNLHKPVTRSDEVESEEAEDDFSISSLVTTSSIFTIKADSIRKNFFLLFCDNEVTIQEDNTQAPLIDDYGHTIQFGQSYIRARYLEVNDSNKYCHKYEITKRMVAIHPDVVFFPQVPYISADDKFVKFENDIIVELGVHSSL